MSQTHVDQQRKVVEKQSEESLNRDLKIIEERALGDYQKMLGQSVLVKAVSGFVGNDSVDINLDPPAKVRIDQTGSDSVHHWNDDGLDPYCDVTLMEPHPALVDVRSFGIHGPCPNLDGKRTEASEIVEVIAKQTSSLPSNDCSPCMRSTNKTTVHRRVCPVVFCPHVSHSLPARICPPSLTCAQQTRSGRFSIEAHAP